MTFGFGNDAVFEKTGAESVVKDLLEHQLGMLLIVRIRHLDEYDRVPLRLERVSQLGKVFGQEWEAGL